MAEIIVQYANDEDASEARKVRDEMNASSGLEAVARKTDTVNLDDWSGVVVIGGSVANPVYSRFQQKFGWNSPTESIFTVGNIVVTGLNRANSTVIQGIAGYTAEDTTDAVNAYLGETDNFFIQAAFDDFLDEVNEILGFTAEPVDDPTGSFTDPDTSSPDFKELTITRPRNFEGGIIGLSQTYKIEVSGIIESTSANEDDDRIINDAYNGIAEGNIEVGGNDRFRFSGSLENVEYSGNDNLEIVIDGNKQVYNSNTGDLEEPEETSQKLTDRLNEVIQNPLRPDNLVVVALIFMLLMVGLKFGSTAENISG